SRRRQTTVLETIDLNRFLVEERSCVIQPGAAERTLQLFLGIVRVYAPEMTRIQNFGASQPTTFKWEKKDGELPPLAKVDGAFLRFEMLNKSDNGVYLCQADNGIGNRGQGEYTLLVQDPMDPDAEYTTTSSATFPDFSTSTSSLTSSSSSTSEVFSTSSSSSSPPDLTSTPPTPSTADMSTTTSDSSITISDSPITISDSSTSISTTTLSNALFPDLPFSPSSSLATPPPPTSASFAPSTATPSDPSLASSLTPSVSVRLNGVYTFTGTYLTHEAKGSDDAPDADTAIINAEGGHSGAEDKKEYFI
ncbi:hypothetical protein INR49_009023, partial [Caranx melampygus]